MTWGGRAAASFQLAVQAATPDERRRRVMDGENYRQEAIEHAAMTEDFDFVHQVCKALDEDRAAALATFQSSG